MAKSIDRPFEGSRASPETVVGFAEPVERNPDIRDAEVFQPLGGMRVDPRAVGENGHLQPARDRIPGHVVKMGMEHRIPSGEQDRRHTAVGQIVDDTDHLFEGQLSRIMFGRGVRVAMEAPEIAAAGDVPDDRRFAFGSGGRGTRPFPVDRTGRPRRAAEEFCHVDHHRCKPTDYAGCWPDDL